MPNVTRRIYLDYHATTPVDPRVARVVVRHMTECFGNAGSADHVFGDDAATAVDVAASEVARLCGAQPSDVLFTSGATESINLVVKGLAAALTGRRPLRILVSPTEHVAVLHTCMALSRSGLAELRWLSVDSRGHVDVAEIDALCRDGTDLLCVMAANNEIGTIAPAETIATVARQHGVAYLCDASQAGGRVALDSLAGRDAFVVLSAHKMYGPKGVGALVAPLRRLLRPLTHGGEQQNGLRAGTLNVPGIAALGVAARLRREEMAEDEIRIGRLRDRLQDQLVRDIPGVVVNGDMNSRLAGNLHISVPGVPNGAIIARVRDRLAIATGSACASGIEAPSHVLRALNLPADLLDGAIRMGLGKWTTTEDVDEAGAMLVAAVRATKTAGQALPS